jgi:hypothetical protein
MSLGRVVEELKRTLTVHLAFFSAVETAAAKPATSSPTITTCLVTMCVVSLNTSESERARYALPKRKVLAGVRYWSARLFNQSLHAKTSETYTRVRKMLTQMEASNDHQSIPFGVGDASL